MADITQIMLRGMNDQEAKDAAKAAFNDAEEFRNLAVAFLKKKWQRVHSERSSKTSYESPAWAEYQADSLGTLRTIEEILKEVFSEEVS